MENGHVNKEGSLRRLTLGEIALAKTVFGIAIAYHKVWIHCDSYLPFGLQKPNVAMAPNGEIYFRKHFYKEDFSTRPPDEQYVFIHEMAHVWQYQKGMWVRARGFFSWAVSYNYKLNKSRLGDYPMEQQASIIADFFYIKNYGLGKFHGFYGRCYIGRIDKSILPIYKSMMHHAGLSV
ncbi:type IV secretion protein Rhs [Serratia rubidaea]|uniref:type IV secretion protein Rhs n=1 Tax=Serratia rubidaea TaxID=61652 RepID=UPI0023AFB0E1|nr:type IV secretion protein Rhs [Serratia rubidaea]MDK1704625.1 type IV secretion protein Rhs [Serratia rubidaea]